MAKSKSKKSKPSFDAPGEVAAPPASWAYRSDATATPPAQPARQRAPTQRAQGAPAAPPADRRPAAQQVVDRHAKYAAAAGLLPIPMLDMATIVGVQVSMLRALAAQYGVPFSREQGRPLVTTLLGGLMPTLAGHQVMKLVGPVAGMVSVSGFAMASTHAVGRVFITHFESGGTLLDVDVEQSRRHVSAAVSRR
jgi:uncharacterized protein (DUF697 family)